MTAGGTASSTDVLPAIFAEITEFQSRCWEATGVARADIERKLRDIFDREFSFDAKTDAPGVKDALDQLTMPRDDIYVRLRHAAQCDKLPLQCPVTYLKVDAWLKEHFSRSDASDLPDMLLETTGSDQHPIVATAYTGELNACTLRAKDGSRGIVFEDELINLMQVLSPAIFGLFAYIENGTIHVDIKQRTRRPDLRRLRRSHLMLFGAIAGMLTRGSIMQGEDRFHLPMEDSAELQFSMKITSGMFGFVFMHEMGHILASHYELLWGETNRHVPRRTVPEQERAIELCLTRYPEMRDALTSTQVNSFITRQMMEIEADMFSNIRLLNRIKDLESLEGLEALETVCYCIGHVCVLPIFNLIERMALAIAYGGIDSENYPMSLLDEDDLVQNLCIRSTHPSPKNRMDNVIESLMDPRVEKSMVEQGHITWRQTADHFIELHKDISTALDLAYENWIASAEGIAVIERGAGSLKPQWRGLLDELPQPLQ